MPTPTSSHFTDLLLLPPMALAQCIIALLILRKANRHFSKLVTGLIALLLAFAGAFLLVGALSEFSRFATPLCRVFGRPNVAAARTVTFLWCFSSTPAVALYLIVRFFERHAPVHQPERRQLMALAGNALIAAPFVIGGYGAAIGRTNFRVQEVELPVVNLPDDLSRIRIVQLSDLHLGRFLSESELARVIDTANELRPDIAMVTGDLISGPEDPVDIAIKQCARLRANRIFGCLGNHERYAQNEAYVTAQGAKSGIRFLRGEAEALRFGSAELNIAGVDYQPFKDRNTYLASAHSLARPGAVNLMLSHNPDVFPVAARQGWDVTLSGHTHGGQVTIEILNQTLNMARIYTPYVSGMYKLGGSCCYVTRGIGTIAIPARIGATPEITSIRLVKARTNA